MAVLAFCLLALAAAGVVHADKPKVPQAGPVAQAPAKPKPEAADAEDATGAEAAQATTDLSITVLNKVTGKPMVGARVIIRPVTGSSSSTERTDTTDAHGRCTATGLSAGKVKIIVTAAKMESFKDEYVVTGASQSIKIELIPDADDTAGDERDPGGSG
jgi:5-hydroxyisourate hydrolase-like protein (transthyretin family)